MPISNPLEREKIRQAEGNSPRQQKMAVILLAILAVAVVVLSALQFHTKLNAPFAGGEITPDTNIATSTDPNLLDSDGDGLSNYDEINIYGTSPYLEDSDSDGISDYDEIAQGTDPTCPTGQICNSSAETSDSAASSTVDTLAGDLLIPGEATSTGTEIISPTGEVTPAILRQILLQNGYDSATLEKISDEEIMAIYQEAVASQEAAN